jgi:hypothetical protein
MVTFCIREVLGLILCLTPATLIEFSRRPFQPLQAKPGTVSQTGQNRVLNSSFLKHPATQHCSYWRRREISLTTKQYHEVSSCGLS